MRSASAGPARSLKYDFDYPTPSTFRIRLRFPRTTKAVDDDYGDEAVNEAVNEVANDAAVHEAQSR